MPLLNPKPVNCSAGVDRQSLYIMTFEEYLIKKRINKVAFEAGEPARYVAWQEMYEQMHPNSFYIAVKMQVNNVRLRYHLAEEDIPKPAPATAAEKPRPAARRAAPARPAASVPPAVATPATPAAPQAAKHRRHPCPAGLGLETSI